MSGIAAVDIAIPLSPEAGSSQVDLYARVLEKGLHTAIHVPTGNIVSFENYVASGDRAPIVCVEASDAVDKYTSEMLDGWLSHITKGSDVLALEDFKAFVNLVSATRSVRDEIDANFMSQWEGDSAELNSYRGDLETTVTKFLDNKLAPLTAEDISLYKVIIDNMGVCLTQVSKGMRSSNVLNVDYVKKYIMYRKLESRFMQGLEMRISEHD